MIHDHEIMFDDHSRVFAGYEFCGHEHAFMIESDEFVRDDQVRNDFRRHL